MCQRANRGECQYAVCHVCHEEHSKMEKRSRGPVLSEDELMKTCHHEIQNLQIIVDLWWCTKDYLGGPKWLERAKGCVFCERMFTVGDKWKKPFICMGFIWMGLTLPYSSGFKQHHLSKDTFYCCLNPKTGIQARTRARFRPIAWWSVARLRFNCHFRSTINTMKAWAEMGDFLFCITAVARCT